MNRLLTCIVMTVIAMPLLSQIREDFSDSSFEQNPIWSGDTSEFIVDPFGELRLNAAAQSGESHLITPNKLVKNTTWEFQLKIEANPSSSNQAFVYLVSDNANLEGSLNGYFIRVGNTSDEVSLYRQEGNSVVEIIDGTDDVVDINPVSISIKVTRDELGNWELLHDVVGDGEFTSEGVAFDNTHETTDYFGFLCDYTSTRSKLFYFDDVRIYAPLAVDSITVFSQDSLRLDLNTPVSQPEAENIANYSITDLASNAVPISNAKRDETDSSIIYLGLSTGLSTGEFLLSTTLKESITEDEQTVDASFSYRQLSVFDFRVVSSTELRIIFNDSINASSLDAMRYYLDTGIGNPINVQFDPERPFAIIIELGQDLQDGQNYALNIFNIENLKKNSQLTESLNFQYFTPLLPIEGLAIAPNELQITFNKSLDPITSEVVSNYFLDGIDLPVQANVTEPNQVVLAFASDFTDGGHFLSIENVSDANGNNLDSTGVYFSYLSLNVIDIIQVDDRIFLKFNQSIDVQSAEDKNRYEIIQWGNADHVEQIQEGDSLVIISFDQLVNNYYELAFNGILNQATNSMFSDTLGFFYSAPTEYRAIVINEIMADPNPPIGLPETEYIEIFNTTGSDINLNNFTMNETTLPDSIIEAGAVSLIVEESYGLAFENIETLIAVGTLGALNNTGENLVLKDQFGNLVDSLNYSPDWYDDDIKSQGGFSLEQINPYLYCPDDYNWTASIASEGGTPGAFNSVFDASPDQTPPFALRYEILDSLTLEIEFNEAIDETGLLVENILFEGRQVDAYRALEYSKIIISLQSPIVSEEFQQLIIYNNSDCNGIVSLSDTINFYYDYSPPKLRDVHIIAYNLLALTFHETLDVPQSLKESNYRINGIAAETVTLSDSLNNQILISLPFDMLIDQPYEIQFSSVSDTIGNLASGVEEIIFNDHIDDITVIAPDLLMIKFTQQIALSGTIYNYYIDDLGHPEYVMIDQTDSSIVRLVLPKNIRDNKYYTIFISGLIKVDGSNLITPARQFINDTKPPDIIHVEPTSPNDLVLTFGEALNPPSAINTSNYELDNGNKPASAILLSDVQVKLEFERPFDFEKALKLTVYSVQDQNNNQITKKTIDFIYDPLPPDKDTIFQFSHHQIFIRASEKLNWDSLSGDNFLVDDEIQPESIEIFGPDSTDLILTFIQDLRQEENLSLVIKDWADKQGNHLTESINYTLNTSHPIISEIIPISDSSVQIRFSHEMDTQVNLRSNYRIDDRNINGIDQLSESQFKLWMDAQFEDNRMYELQTNGLSSLSGQDLRNSINKFQFEDYFESIEILDSTTLQMMFNTHFFGISNLQFKLDGHFPELTIIDVDNPSIIRLLFAEPFEKDQVLVLQWFNLIDKYNRQLPDVQKQIFIDTHPPHVTHIESNFLNTIDVVFNESIATSQVNSTNHFKIPGMGPSDAVEALDSQTILVQFKQLQEGEPYDLVVTNVPDLSDNYLISDTINFVYQPPPIPKGGEIVINEIMADPIPSHGLPEIEYIELYNKSENDYSLASMYLSDNSDRVQLPAYVLTAHSYVALVNSFEPEDLLNERCVPISLFSLGNSYDDLVLTNLKAENIDQVSYNRDWYHDPERDDGGFSLEMINPDPKCTGEQNWTVSQAESGGTPGDENSVFSLEMDLEPPYILTYYLNQPGELVIHFNETLDSTSIQLSSFHSENVSIDQISLTASSSIAIGLTSLDVGAVYSMTIQDILDCSGNRMEDEQIVFGVGEPPSFNEIIISEIMYDPDPAIGLPNVEYLELYNASDRLISLDGLVLEDLNNTSDFIGGLIFPGAYSVITTTTGAGLFQGNNIIGVKNWIGLSNEGELISLKVNNEVVFSMSYKSDWIDDIDKSEGGYSLEMRDLFNPCGGKINWGASKDIKGGTPGEINSNLAQVPDNFGPNIISVIAIEVDSLIVQFDEQVILHENTTITFDPEIDSYSISTKFNYPEFLFLNTSEILPNQPYTIKIENLTDCQNNRIEANDASFILPVFAQEGDIKISEILFNPRPGGADFLEIYNASDQYILMKGLIISNHEQSKMITDDHLILQPQAYLAFTERRDAVESNYTVGEILEISSIPPMNDDQGFIMITNKEGHGFDSLEYDQQMHYSILADKEGVSLERISYELKANDRNNWKSASGAVGFATPGYQNSQSFEPKNTENPIAVEPKVFVPGTTGTGVPSFTTINYEFNKPGRFVNVNIYNQEGQLVRKLEKGTTLSSSGFLQWDGTDDAGSLVRMGYYLIAFEVRGSGGNTSVIKETVVVGSDFK